MTTAKQITIDFDQIPHSRIDSLQTKWDEKFPDVKMLFFSFSLFLVLRLRESARSKFSSMYVFLSLNLCLEKKISSRFAIDWMSHARTQHSQFFLLSAWGMLRSDKPYTTNKIKISLNLCWMSRGMMSGWGIFEVGNFWKYREFEEQFLLNLEYLDLQLPRIKVRDNNNDDTLRLWNGEGREKWRNGGMRGGGVM